ncbi:uncharacterized protein [Typha angustifolia]|uniref:uncharacterized protein n=1 Tax=Typha angustifolia TaxID=59011 RepID=UPI003C307940
MGFSIVPLIDSLVHRTYYSAGLRPQTLAVDSETTIHCWIPNSLPVANTSPNAKPTLLLIHGFGPRATWQWRNQIGPLSAHFDIIVPDLVFFGGSTTTSPCRSEAFQAAALVRLLESLGLAAAGRVAVVGTSYGGFVAYHVARLLGPDRVNRVVIANSDILKAAEDDRALLKRAGMGSIPEVLLPKDPETVRTLMKLAFYRPPRFVPSFLLRDFIQNLFSDKIEEKMELLKGTILDKKDEFELTPLPQEVLIIWGEHDQIFPLDKAIQVKKRLGDKASLEVLEKTGHVSQVEDSNRFNQILLSFLLGSPKSTL